MAAGGMRHVPSVPALVGPTDWYLAEATRLAFHPRMSGEDHLWTTVPFLEDLPSPHTRGYPACAIDSQVLVLPSPHKRGTRRRPCEATVCDPFIPAYAGEPRRCRPRVGWPTPIPAYAGPTSSSCVLFGTPYFHPRVRGGVKTNVTGTHFDGGGYGLNAFSDIPSIFL